MSRTQEAWTVERMSLLCALHEGGISFAKIAAEINTQHGSSFSRNACIGKAKRLGLIKRHTVTSTLKAQRAKPKRRMVFKKTRPEDREPPQLDVDMPSPDHLDITFFDLKNNFSECRFMQGDGLAGTYCGQPVQEGSSYCSFHHRLCYTKPDTRPRKVFVPGRVAA